jgi:hypothetical protein
MKEGRSGSVTSQTSCARLQIDADEAHVAGRGSTGGFDGRVLKRVQIGARCNRGNRESDRKRIAHAATR